MYGLGRQPFREDIRDDQWPVARLRAMVAAGIAKPLDWSVPRVLGQGTNPTCVSAGILGSLNCDDESHTDPGFTSADIIPFFQTIAGASMVNGAVVREGLRAAKTAGYIVAYSLLRSLDEITEWLENHGPVVVGTYWLSDMDHPAVDGRVMPTGFRRGGHCYYGHGDLQGYDWVNSWTEAWGRNGHFYTTRDDWLQLYNDYGEAWAVVQAVAPPKPLPWSDLVGIDISADDSLSITAAYSSGVLVGYPDGTFRPGISVTSHQVGTVMVRLGVLLSNPWNELSDYSLPCTRGFVHHNLPGLVFLEERWTEPLMRYQLLLLVGRHIREAT